MSSPFFRSPLEGSSSTDDTSSGASSGKDEASDNLDATENVYDLARVKTTQSATSIEELSRSLTDSIIGQPYEHRDFITHAMLEENCLFKALEQLNADRDGQTNRLYTKEDPEIKELAKSRYQHIVEELAARGLPISDLHLDDFQEARSNYAKALDFLSQKHDKNMTLRQQRSVSGRKPVDARPFRLVSNLSVPGKRKSLDGPPVTTRSAIAVGAARKGDGQIGVLQPLVDDEHPLFQHTPTMHGFYDLEVIGKGGFGTVFKANNPLDGGSYAIKRIPLSAARIHRIEKRGQAELDALLKEVRTMQRLDHPNIVRYHNAWLERTTMGPQAVKGKQKLLGYSLSTSSPAELDSSEAPHTTAGLDPDHCTDDDFLFDDAIVFGEDSISSRSAPSELQNGESWKRRGSHANLCSSASHGRDNGMIIEHDKSLSGVDKTPPRRRRESHVTPSSSVSKRSFVHSAGEELDEDEDVETIPRDMNSLSFSGQREPSFGIVFEEEEDSKEAQHQSPQIHLALHIQMALYPMSLADYISSTPVTCVDGKLEPHHCFHVKVSLQILLAILDGVQYLHAQDMVHRDLKPANIFLSPFEDKYRHKSCVYLGGCRECATAGQCKDSQLGIRIGDFGLVADIARPESHLHDSPVKAVGTEFYRPSVASAQPNEKLDVFALGIIAFELLWKFDTRMERAETLMELKNGRLPTTFSHKMDLCGNRLVECIRGMVCSNESERLSCQDVQQELEAILEVLHT